MAMFVFRMRAYAAAHFDFDEVLSVSWHDGAVGVLQSEYTGGEHGDAYPVTLHGEIRGPGESLAQAEPRLASAIGNTLPIIALAANASVANPLPLAAHGLDLTTPQPYTAYQTPRPDEWFPPGGRRINRDATLALCHAVGNHPQTALLHRAVETYRRALFHWVPEEHLLAGEFLFISAETLSRLLIESRAAAEGITPKNLVRLTGAGSEKHLRRRFLLEDIFHGDDLALDAMEAASNGFEHGYMAVDDVRGLLEDVLERSMRHVRRSLIEASGLGDTPRRLLLDDEYDEPRGLVPVIRFVQGQLSRQDPDRSAPQMDSAPVEVDWHVKQLSAARGPDGKINITWQQHVTATKLPDNTKIEVGGFGVRAAHVHPTADAPLIEVNRAGDTA